VKDSLPKYVAAQALWQALKQGERPALAGLYTLFSKELLRFGRQLTTDESLLKDTLQDLFIHLWERRDYTTTLSSTPFFEKLAIICQAIGAHYQVVDAKVVVSSTGCR